MQHRFYELDIKGQRKIEGQKHRLNMYYFLMLIVALFVLYLNL